jgi:ferredoxin
VVAGGENLAEPTPREEVLRREKGFRDDERAACQAAAVGDVVITTTYW